MLKDLKVNYVILGHSERRNILKESDEVFPLFILDRVAHFDLERSCLTVCECVRVFVRVCVCVCRLLLTRSPLLLRMVLW